MALRTYFLHQLRWLERLTHERDDFSVEMAVEQAYGFLLGLYLGRDDQFTDEISEIWCNWRGHMLFGIDYTLPDD